jgi:hypothetical protein
MASLRISFSGRRRPPPIVKCKKCGYQYQLSKKPWVKRLGKLPELCPRHGYQSRGELEVVA